jgi:AsmA family protein
MSLSGLTPSTNTVRKWHKWQKMHRALLRTLKIVAGILLGVLLVCVAALVIYLKTLDFNSYKPLIQDAVLKASGRALIIDGSMDLSISLHPSLTVEGVHLANGPGFSRANMADVQRMQIEISLLPLLSGELRIERIVLFRPDILLETRADGSDNWDFSGGGSEPGISPTAEAKPGSPILLPQVHELMIREATLAYRDAASGQTRSLGISRLELWEDGHAADEPLHLAANVEYGQIPLKVQGKLGSMHALLTDEPLDVALHADVPGAELKVDGSVAHPLSGSGMALGIDLSAPGLGKLGKLLKMPPALNLPLHLAATLKNDKDGFALQNMQASLGTSDVSGNVRLALWQPRLHVVASLRSKHFSLKDFLPAETKPAPPPEAGNPGRLLPSTPFDLHWLTGFDADVDWKAGQLSLPDAELADIDAKLSLDHGALKISPLKLGLAGGDVRVEAVLHAEKTPPQINIALTGRHIDSAQLLSLIGPEAETGQAPAIEGAGLDADVKLAGSGISVADLLAHANGRIKLRLGPGRVKGDALNMIGGDMLTTLADKLSPASDRNNYTELQCGVVHFRVENGLMISNNGIAFETKRTNLLSQGKINLRDESIDLSIGTQPREGLGVNLSNMVNVVRLGGTLAKPAIVVDVGKTGLAAARTAGALATGGLSLLGEGLFDRITADKTPCKTALEMK